MSLFPSKASLKELAHVCRSLGTSLHSGIDLLRALQMTSKRSSGEMKRVLLDILDQIKSGSDITSAVEAHGRYFPELFADIVQIGEHAGALPEALLALSDHYENNIRLRKEFLSQIAMPAIQLTVAVFVIAGLILLLGMIGESTGTTFDILGWGLLGASGAITWLGFWAMGIISLIVIYKLLSNSMAGQKALHRTLLSIPVVGRCMQDFAIARFSWAFHLTQNAGMPIDDSLDASLRATSNGAFISAASQINYSIRNGENLTDSLQSSGLFPIEFVQTVDVAETSGTVPEALHRLSPQFEENARRSLKALASAAGWACWIAVAGFIIFIVFTIVLWYVGQLNDAINMI
ncbi:type II secretion system F family protein [bacterium]|nr:type II secretion system F family protein [bacterium]